MTFYYVTKAGNDSTGTGTVGNPWLTVAHAIASGPTSADTLWIGPGTYAEDSGSGYLNMSIGYASTRLLIAPLNGTPGSVIITGASAGTITQAIAIGNVNFVWFDGIVFQAQSATVNIAFRFISTAITGVEFSRCTFTAYSSSSQTNVCVNSGAGFTTTGITFRQCTFNQIGPYSANGLTLADTTGVSTGLLVEDCDFNMGGRCYNVSGISGQVLDSGGDSWNPTVGAEAFLWGIDGPTGPAFSGLVAGCDFSTLTSHACIIGAGANGVDVINNKWRGGNNSGVGQGLVIKEALNTRVIRNDIMGGYLSGLYFKAAVDCQAIENTIYNPYANSPALRVGINSEDSLPCQRITVRRNTFIASAGTIFGWEAASGDSGGSVCDENVYILRGSATLGSIRGITVATETDMRAAWAAYDHPNNDINSRIGPKHAVFAGLPFATLPS